MPPQLFEIFNGVQLILHAGDLVERAVLDELTVLAPVEAVAGNMDPINLYNQLGRIKLIKAGDLNIGLLHGDIGSRSINLEQMNMLFSPVQLHALVFGHLHQPLVKVFNNVLFFNPGSAVDPRREPKPSCGRLLIRESKISGEIIYL